VVGAKLLHFIKILQEMLDQARRSNEETHEERTALSFEVNAW
jgi:hypothetical protein